MAKFKIIVLILLVISQFIQCDKPKRTVKPADDFPEIFTYPISAVGEYSVMAGGNLVAQSTNSINEMGLCFDANPNPSIAKSKVICDIRTGLFTQAIDSLLPSKKYYIKAFVTVGNSTIYGQEYSFTTKGWLKVNSTIEYNYSQVFFTNNDFIFKKKIVNDCGLYKSQDGMNWTLCSNGLPASASQLQYLNQSFVYGPEIYLYQLGMSGALYKSSDNGNQWHKINCVFNGYPGPPTIFAKYNGVLFAHDAGNVYKSLNDGETWLKIRSGLDTWLNSGLAVSSTLFLCGNSGLYKSVNEGFSWTKVSNIAANKLYQFEDSLYLINNYVYASNDLGQNWRLIKNNALSNLYAYQGTLYGAVNGFNLIEANNPSINETWKMFHAGFPPTNIDFYGFWGFRNYLFAWRADGLWRYDL